MKEITYGDLLDCYNTLLEYAGKQFRHLMDAEKKAGSLRSARDNDEIATPAGIDSAIDNAETAAETARRKVTAAMEIIADFYFDGDTDDAQSAIRAMTAYLDLEDRAAEALAELAPPERRPGEVIVW